MGSAWGRYLSNYRRQKLRRRKRGERGQKSHAFGILAIIEVMQALIISFLFHRFYVLPLNYLLLLGGPISLFLILFYKCHATFFFYFYFHFRNYAVLCSMLSFMIAIRILPFQICPWKKQRINDLTKTKQSENLKNQSFEAKIMQTYWEHIS